jgi:cob(I)alamin adenosyltransferase
LASANLHVCRAVTRRAERAVFDLVQEGDCEPVVAKYLNRLSDFFFVAARFASMKNNREEVVYKKE